MQGIDPVYEWGQTGARRASLASKPFRADPALFQRIDLNLFKIFLEISRAGGIGAAARRLNLQQPAVAKTSPYTKKKHSIARNKRKTSKNLFSRKALLGNRKEQNGKDRRSGLQKE